MNDLFNKKIKFEPVVISDEWWKSVTSLSYWWKFHKKTVSSAMIRIPLTLLFTQSKKWIMLIIFFNLFKFLMKSNISWPSKNACKKNQSSILNLIVSKGIKTNICTENIRNKNDKIIPFRNENTKYYKAYSRTSHLKENEFCYSISP